MRQHIDTAPIIEAFSTDSECPLCDLRDKTEQSYLEYFLGGSVMEPAERVVVNDKGFCANHFVMLAGQGNKLGLALLADTRMREVVKHIESSRRPAKRSMFARRDAMAQEPTCALCDRLNNTMSRYLETLIYLYERDESFRGKFCGCNGLCVNHYNALIAFDSPDAFKDDCKAVTLAGLKRVESELEWFTLKFDYRNADKPWGNSKDALQRAIRKLSCARVEER